MRTIIAGCRDITDLAQVHFAMECAAYYFGIVPTLVVSGGARGADRLGELWAQQRGIPMVQYPADWDQYGRRAGPIRNGVMAKSADALVALWDGESRGTEDMINQARDAGLKVYVFYTRRK